MLLLPNCSKDLPPLAELSSLLISVTALMTRAAADFHPPPQLLHLVVIDGPLCFFFLCVCFAVYSYLETHSVVRSSAREEPTGRWLGRMPCPLKPTSLCRKEAAFCAVEHTFTWVTTCQTLDWSWLEPSVEMAWWVAVEEVVPWHELLRSSQGQPRFWLVRCLSTEREPTLTTAVCAA